MIYEWKLDGVTRNFGDALYEVLYSSDSLLPLVQDDDKCHFLIGSVICNSVILEAINLGLAPVFTNCGWRGEPLDRALVDQATFIGCRGPNTRNELARHGVAVSVTGDPAGNIPLRIPKSSSTGTTLMIPHVKDPLTYDYDKDYHGVDEIVSTAVTDIQSIVDLIRKISGAKFVLTGSLHAAIAAHAYGVPFAIMRSYVDCVPKWVDWGMAANIEKLDFRDRLVQ